MRLRFGRLTASEVTTALVRDHELSETDARAAAPLADGSIGQALALTDNDLSDAARFGHAVVAADRGPRRYADAAAGRHGAGRGSIEEGTQPRGPRRASCG